MRKEGLKVITIGMTEASITHNAHLMIAGHGAQALRVDMKSAGVQGDTKPKCHNKHEREYWS
jgi:hypothetical protein